MFNLRQNVANITYFFIFFLIVISILSDVTYEMSSTISRHFSRSLAALTHSANVLPVNFQPWSVYREGDLPLPRIPSIFPDMVSVLTLSCLIKWPKNFSTLFLTVVACLSWIPSSLLIDALVRFAVQSILSMEHRGSVLYETWRICVWFSWHIRIMNWKEVYKD